MSITISVFSHVSLRGVQSNTKISYQSKKAKKPDKSRFQLFDVIKYCRFEISTACTMLKRNRMI